MSAATVARRRRPGDAGRSWSERRRASEPSMTNLLILIPAALALGGLGLAAFLWALRSGQYDDLDGAAHRILDDDQDDAPKQ
jgi:cbb3-type cytochrome oxidase maturation protein